MAVSLMLNVSQNVSKLDQNNLHACVPLSTPVRFIFSINRLPQNLMLECLHFSDPCSV